MVSHVGSIKSGLSAADAENPTAHAESNNPPELRALVEQNYGSVTRLLRRLGVRTAQIDDAAQEVFWIAARRMADIQPGRGHAFLYGVALRVASQETRKQRLADPIADLEAVPRLRDQEPSPEEHLERQQARELLDTILDALPEELRAVLVLFELEGLEVREIAALQEIPIGTASSRLRRAREEFSAIAKRVRAAVAARERQPR
ncbi:MAG TPA: sigma-70 family RNA polymerase sigma factor [Polyangiaceae bacterium]